MAYSTTREGRGIIVTFHGDVPMAEVEAANTRFYNDPRFDDIRFLLWDMSRVTTFGATMDDARQTAYQNLVANSYKSRLRIAYVQSADPAINEVLAFYIRFSGEIGNVWEQCLFTSLEEAKAWAGATG